MSFSFVPMRSLCRRFVRHQVDNRFFKQRRIMLLRDDDRGMAQVLAGGEEAVPRRHHRTEDFPQEMNRVIGHDSLGPQPRGEPFQDPITALAAHFLPTIWALRIGHDEGLLPIQAAKFTDNRGRQGHKPGPPTFCRVHRRIIVHDDAIGSQVGPLRPCRLLGPHPGAEPHDENGISRLIDRLQRFLGLSDQPLHLVEWDTPRKA